MDVFEKRPLVENLRPELVSCMRQASSPSTCCRPEAASGSRAREMSTVGDELVSVELELHEASNAHAGIPTSHSFLAGSLSGIASIVVGQVYWLRGGFCELRSRRPVLTLLCLVAPPRFSPLTPLRCGCKHRCRPSGARWTASASLCPRRVSRGFACSLGRRSRRCPLMWLWPETALFLSFSGRPPGALQGHGLAADDLRIGQRRGLLLLQRDHDGEPLASPPPGPPQPSPPPKEEPTFPDTDA
jgi:hypothetical protein